MGILTMTAEESMIFNALRVGAARNVQNVLGKLPFKPARVRAFNGD